MPVTPALSRRRKIRNPQCIELEANLGYMGPCLRKKRDRRERRRKGENLGGYTFSPGVQSPHTCRSVILQGPHAFWGPAETPPHPFEVLEAGPSLHTPLLSALGHLHFLREFTFHQSQERSCEPVLACGKCSQGKEMKERKDRKYRKPLFILPPAP